MVLHELGARLVAEDRLEHDPQGDDVVVRVRGCGICHSDLHQIDWGATTLPIVLGHEVSGETDELGPVLVYGAWGCGRCERCLRGEEQLCDDLLQPGFDRDGGYAETMLVPSSR
jgi:propanol-preferring alcohol dehydrogenase